MASYEHRDLQIQMLFIYFTALYQLLTLCSVSCDMEDDESEDFVTTQR